MKKNVTNETNERINKILHRLLVEETYTCVNESDLRSLQERLYEFKDLICIEVVYKGAGYYYLHVLNRIPRFGIPFFCNLQKYNGYIFSKDMISV